MSFAELEKQFIRARAYRDFDWVRYDLPSRVNPPVKPLAEARVAFVTTSGAHLKSDPAFNLKSSIGDPSFRVIPGDVRMEDLILSHVGYNTGHVSGDKNCVFPLDRLRELEAERVIGELAPRHFSFMGYVAVADSLIQETAPEVARMLQSDGADLVLLAPA